MPRPGSSTADCVIFQHGLCFYLVCGRDADEDLQVINTVRVQGTQIVLLMTSRRRQDALPEILVVVQRSPNFPEVILAVLDFSSISYIHGRGHDEQCSEADDCDDQQDLDQCYSAD